MIELYCILGLVLIYDKASYCSPRYQMLKCKRVMHHSYSDNASGGKIALNAEQRDCNGY